MAHKQISLDLAAFMDSPQARALATPGTEDVRRIASSFLAICYDELGKKPRLLDGQDVHEVLGHALPGRLKRKDPLAEHVPAVLRAFFDHLETSEIVPQAYEMRSGLESTVEEFLETVRTGRNVHHGHVRPDAPFVHKAEKLGRNDPCSCGSGKKYKKCHGRNA